MIGAVPPLRLYAFMLCEGISSDDHCSLLFFYALVAFLESGRTYKGLKGKMIDLCTLEIGMFSLIEGSQPASQRASNRK